MVVLIIGEMTVQPADVKKILEHFSETDPKPLSILREFEGKYPKGVIPRIVFYLLNGKHIKCAGKNDKGKALYLLGRDDSPSHRPNLLMRVTGYGTYQKPKWKCICGKENTITRVHPSAPYTANSTKSKCFFCRRTIIVQGIRGLKGERRHETPRQECVKIGAG